MNKIKGKIKANELFADKKEKEFFQRILKLFNGKIIAIYERIKNEKIHRIR